jgi:NAD+ diphosphatase
MRHAEEVTFGGSGLDRSAELRGNEAEQARMLLSGWVLPLWRGKPLIEAGSRLGWVRHDSPVLQGGEPVVFLGLDAGQSCFAQDISHWSPEAGAAAVEGGLFDLAVQTHPALESHFAFQDLRNVMALLSPRDAELAAMAKGVLLWHRSHGFCAACGARSVPAQAGWQRDCPACSAHHFPRTDPVVIMLVERGNKLLLGRSAVWPDGMYSLLAGFVEPGETIEAAVRREVFEESGIRVGEVRYLASQPWPFPASLMFGCHARAISDTITLDPTELEDARWVTREEMVQVLAGQHPVIKPGRKGAIAHFLISNWLADRLN